MPVLSRTSSSNAGLTRRPGSQSTPITSCTTSEDLAAATFIRASCTPTRMATHAARVSPLPLLSIPRRVEQAKPVRLRIRSAQSLAAAEILALGLSIPGVLAEVTAQTQGPATNALTQGIQQGLGDTKPAAA